MAWGLFALTRDDRVGVEAMIALGVAADVDRHSGGQRRAAGVDDRPLMQVDLAVDVRCRFDLELETAEIRHPAVRGVAVGRLHQTTDGFQYALHDRVVLHVRRDGGKTLSERRTGSADP